ncbi:type II toxin-antitoxin system RelE/ParE family toxin [bacterium]|nr:type II toxin-antitoxin system RelE/ParE family toxin [bacterium]
MEISFKTPKLAKLCSSRDSARRRWGTESGDKILRRLNEMKAADTLADLIKLPQANCHMLHGDLKGQWSVNLAFPYRLLFIPANEPLPLKHDGSVDTARVTAVMVSGVEDTHG